MTAPVAAGLLGGSTASANHIDFFDAPTFTLLDLAVDGAATRTQTGLDTLSFIAPGPGPRGVLSIALGQGGDLSATSRTSSPLIAIQAEKPTPPHVNRQASSSAM